MVRGGESSIKPSLIVVPLISDIAIKPILFAQYSQFLTTKLYQLGIRARFILRRPVENMEKLEKEMADLKMEVSKISSMEQSLEALKKMMEQMYHHEEEVLKTKKELEEVMKERREKAMVEDTPMMGKSEGSFFYEPWSRGRESRRLSPVYGETQDMTESLTRRVKMHVFDGSHAES